MISVIVGHTIRNRYVRGMIYSVHMPLFFFLSGITVKVPSSIRDWSELKLCRNVVVMNFCFKRRDQGVYETIQQSISVSIKV